MFMNDNIITISNLSFAYNKNDTVLSNVSLTIKRGTINGIFGPNGCGKTTLLSCIIKLFKCKGNIFINDKSIYEMSYKELANRISFVPQTINLVNDFYVRDYIALGLNPRLKFYESPSEELYKKVDEISNSLNMQNIVNKRMG